ncbi:MAG: THUMP domain-containing protein [Myxococcota bacterium]|nr:THUMP domain-containing protein [Myxococcota bacterium]
MPYTHHFTATVTRGAEEVLAEELGELGIQETRVLRGAVGFSGPLALGYRVCLHSRLASRVLLVVKSGAAPTADALYAGVRTINWLDHIDPKGTLAVDFVGTSQALHHSGFAARKVKDAIVDTIRDATGERPGVDLKNPQLRVNVHLYRNDATVSIDLSGAPLHLRGLSRHQGEAPLKETLAAAILRLSGWPEAAREGKPLFDPMCGCGTFLTEAAGMALGKAPGLHRKHWGFSRWRGHDKAAWRQELKRAQDSIRDVPLRIRGADHNPKAIENTRWNLDRAGFSGKVQVEVGELENAEPRPRETPGLLVTNPPFGERLGDGEEAVETYRLLGNVMRRRFLGWNGWVLAGSPMLGKQLGLKPKSKTIIFNGPIECRLVEIPISAKKVERDQ